MPIMTFNRRSVVNYLIINVFTGGVSVASNETSKLTRRLLLLLYVAQKLFITQCRLNVTYKGSKKLTSRKNNIMIYKQCQ